MRIYMLFVSGSLFLPVDFLSTGILASTILSGFVNWDVASPGNAGQFEILNRTGTNASVFPDATFPITTELGLSQV